MPMKFRMNQLTSLLVAVSFILAALGLSISVSHASPPSMLCNGFASSSIQSGQELAQAQVSNFVFTGMSEDSLVGQSKSDAGTVKSPCCSSFCSSAFFSFSDSSLKDVAIVDNSDWPVSIEVLNSAESDGLKRPPRATFMNFPRA